MPRPDPRTLARRLLAGGPHHRSRLHTEDGRLLPWREWRHIPGTVAGAAWARLRGERPERPWWPVTVAPLIAAHLASRPARVLEFGSGSSTLWLARRARSVVSVESDPDWARRTRDRLDRAGLAGAAVRLTPPELTADLGWAGDDRFDLVVVDGPRRWLCVEAALPRLAPGGLLYLDNSDSDKDAGTYPDPGMTREAQRRLADRAAAHPGWRLDRLVAPISGEFAVGEGMLLRAPPHIA